MADTPTLFDTAEAEADPTWTVARLAGAVGRSISRTFPEEVWVRGEIANFDRAQRRRATRHVYFDLVEEGSAEAWQAPRLPVMIMEGDRERINRALGAVSLGDGTVVRLRGRVVHYAPQGRVQLRVTAVDPTFTLGALAMERERLLALLRADGSLRRNAALPLPLVPLRLALITSPHTAADADVRHQLAASGFRWEVATLPVRVEGADAVPTLVGALRRVASMAVDVVLVVRGGGARTQLTVFDTEQVARAIASCPHPVITGIGHETDHTLADDVAHASHKTPTAAAAALVERVAAFMRDTQAAWAAVRRCAEGSPAAATRDLDAVASRLAVATHSTVRHETVKLDHVRERLHVGGVRALDAATTSVELAANTARHSSSRRLTRATAEVRELSALLVRRGPRPAALAEERLDHVAARIHAYDPVAALARGWSITRDGNGRALRSVDGVAPGDVFVTQFQDGSVSSKVEKVTPSRTNGENR